MQKDINFPTMALINDIDALITEIDRNPQISSWVVRLVLKSIKEKARNMVSENTPKLTCLNQQAHLDVFVNSSSDGTCKITTLR